MVVSAEFALAAKLMLDPNRTTVPFPGLVKVTLGARSTNTETTDEVVINPKLSVATALNLFVPTAALLQTKLYGALATVPSKFVSSKNCTCAIPFVEATFASKLIAVPGTITALLAGLVNVTVGGTSTVIATTEEVVTNPKLSVARAVSA